MSCSWVRVQQEMRTHSEAGLHKRRQRQRQKQKQRWRQSLRHRQRHRHRHRHKHRHRHIPPTQATQATRATQATQATQARAQAQAQAQAQAHTRRAQGGTGPAPPARTPAGAGAPCLRALRDSRTKGAERALSPADGSGHGEGSEECTAQFLYRPRSFGGPSSPCTRSNTGPPMTTKSMRQSEPMP